MEINSDSTNKVYEVEKIITILIANYTRTKNII